MRWWSPEDEDDLRKLFVAGLSDLDIGRRMGRPEGGIKKRRHRLGLHRAEKQKMPRGVWTKDELRKLEKLVKEGADDKAIAARVGRSELAVYTKRQKMGIGIASPRWEDSEAAKARALQSEGATQREIGETLGRSAKAVERFFHRTRSER